MKCLSCDRILNDYESTRKYENGEYVDMCNSCFNKSDMSDIVIIDRSDLAQYEELDDDTPDIMEDI